jgi:putative oxidoreductase
VLKYQLKFEAMKRFKTVYFLLILLLLILWIPASISKMYDFENFRKSIINQPFNKMLAHIVIYTIPILEIFVVVLLLINKSRLIGLFLSSFLLSVFTGYIGLALLNTWEKLPCGCGLIISSLNWKEHLLLIIFFLTINVICILLEYKKGKFPNYNIN